MGFNSVRRIRIREGRMIRRRSLRRAVTRRFLSCSIRVLGRLRTMDFRRSIIVIGWCFRIFMSCRSGSTAPPVVSQIVNGWQVSGVTQFQSGSPGNVQIGYDWNGDGIANDRPQVANVKAPLATYAVRGDDPNLFGLAAGTYCDGAFAIYTSDPCHPVAAGSFRWLLPFFGTTGNSGGSQQLPDGRL